MKEQLMNTGLDSESLAICIKLCESGVNPEALAAVIKELKRESAALNATDSSSWSRFTSWNFMIDLILFN